MRILVTNDDGIDSVGLHVLARAMNRHGEVVVVAPDREYSGASSAVGALHVMQPEVHKAHIEGMKESWALSGPPALCVMFARLGLFGAPFDLVVAGINPGANVGRSVYHSGTIGAALTARNGGISGVAISQAVNGMGVEGLIAHPPSEPVVVNVNVPNLPVSEIKSWRRTVVGSDPPRAMATATMEQKEGHSDSYYVRMAWGDELTLPIHTDGGAVGAGEVSITYISRLEGIEIPADSGPERAIASLLKLS